MLSHYSDVIMSAMASQITDVSMVCSSVCSSAGQRKHQSPAALAFVKGIHRWIPLTKASNAEIVCIWWRHHGDVLLRTAIPHPPFLHHTPHPTNDVFQWWRRNMSSAETSIFLDLVMMNIQQLYMNIQPEVSCFSKWIWLAGRKWSRLFSKRHVYNGK